MNTKLNINAIEQGSIPLSALASEVKDKIENAGGADWNAKEGEAGYIENRTHYVTGTVETINANGEWSITKTNIIVNDDSIIDISWNIDFMGEHTEGSCRFTGTDESNNYYFDNDRFNIDFINHGGLIDLDMWAFGGADPHYGTVTIGVDFKCKTLDEVYIPDTVIKTTPQTLTNADKNQALTNLGIDPVVWKYMCNPCEIYVKDSYYDNNNVPEDIIPIIFNEDGTPNKNLLNLCVFKILFGSTEYLAKPIYIEDNSYIHVNIEGIILRYEQSDNAIYLWA